MEFDYTVKTDKSFDEAVRTVEEETAYPAAIFPGGGLRKLAGRS